MFAKKRLLARQSLQPSRYKINLADFLTSVAEPEPVERQRFSGVKAQVCGPDSVPGYIYSYKMLQKSPKFFILKFEVEF
jgi:hypothetical protein